MYTADTSWCIMDVEESIIASSNVIHTASVNVNDYLPLFPLRSLVDTACLVERVEPEHAG
jgi:hypothetical protein